MSSDLQFEAAMNRLSDRLKRLLEDTVQWSTPTEMRLASQAQARQATIAIANGERQLPSSHLRAAIYDLCRFAEEARVFPRVSCSAVRELAVQTLEGVDNGSATIAMGGLRSMLERMALAAWLAHKMVGFASIERPTFEDFMAHSAPVTRALYGTGVNWIELAQADLRKLPAKDVVYRRLEDSANMERVQILSAMDRLDKTVSGTRVAYEILCEFLHPNVGDLFSATADAESLTDVVGTRRIVRHLGRSKRVFAGSPDLQRIAAQVSEIFADVASGYPATLAELDAVASKAVRVSRANVHRRLREQRSLFKANDQCPCNSGRTVRQCGLG